MVLVRCTFGRRGSTLAESHANLQILADHDEVLCGVHREICDGERQALGFERYRWILEPLILVPWQRYQPDGRGLESAMLHGKTYRQIHIIIILWPLTHQEDPFL